MCVLLLAFKKLTRTNVKDKENELKKAEQEVKRQFDYNIMWDLTFYTIIWLE